MAAKVIGLCGYAGVGKTTFANRIVKKFPASTILPFAAPLKQLARDFFGWNGEKDERGRKLLQALGTDVARAWDVDFWVKKWLHTANEYQRFKYMATIIADDVRFQNEVDAIHSLGGVVIYLERYGVTPHPSAHASELPDQLSGIDLYVSLDDLPYDFELGNKLSLILRGGGKNEEKEKEETRKTVLDAAEAIG